LSKALFGQTLIFVLSTCVAKALTCFFGALADRVIKDRKADFVLAGSTTYQTSGNLLGGDSQAVSLRSAGVERGG
jgi:hypothetical protein